MANVQIDFSFGPEDTGTLKSLVDEFNQQHPGTHVKYRQMPADTDMYHKMLRNMFRSPSGRIDVIAGDIIWLAEFAENDWIADLSGRFPQSERQQFLDATIEANTYEQGKVWGVPWFTDVGLLYYRRDLLANNPPPKTWNELKQMALQFKQAPGIQHGYVFQGAQYEGGVCNGLEFIWTHGGNVLDSNNQVIINSDKAKQGLTAERDMVADGVAPQDVHTYTEGEAAMAFLNGQAVFCRNWPFLYGLLGQPGVLLTRDKVGVTELPRAQGIQQGGGCLGGWNMFINARSPIENQNAAWQFVKFMTDEAQQKKMASGASRLPTRKALYRNPHLAHLAGSDLRGPLPIMNFIEEALKRARPRPVHPCYLEMSGEMAEQFNLSLKSAFTVQTLQTELSDIVERCPQP